MSHINKQYEHIFIHVPKCAGTSMERFPFVGGSGHATARSLRVRPYRHYYCWGFVRHPADRLVSVYHAAKQHAAKWPKAESCETFAEFVHKLQDDKRLVGEHTMPMTHFTCDRDGQLLLDFVGRYERLVAHWLDVCKLIGVPQQPLPHRNTTKHAAAPTYYTKQLYEMVVGIYEDDFLTFRYQRRYKSWKRRY